MRNPLLLTLAIIFSATAAYAQGTRGYIEGAAGVSDITGASATVNTNGEIVIRVGPRVVLFGDIGRIHDAQSSSVQASVNNAVSALATSDDLTATGTAHVPAWYSLGGARVNLSNRTAFTPYVFGGMGFARLNPSVRFLYDSGTTLTGNAATAGDDITSDVVASGLFTTPTATTGLMLRAGGGVQVPLGKYLLGNVGYSVSRISSDTPIHAQDLTFGVGIKF
jgi:hypothetical protein